MATDSRAALAALIAALRAHHDAAVAEQDPDSDVVLDAVTLLADAYDTYDEVLYEQTGVDTPFYLDDDDDEDDDDDDDLDIVDDIDGVEFDEGVGER